MATSTVPQLSKRNTILKGYAAFNDADWDTMRRLLCENVTWHRMEHDPAGPGVISGREDVITYLQGLRSKNEAEFLGMAIQGDQAITVDFTHSLLGDGDHGCADRILFDTSGCIREVFHCATDTLHHEDMGAS
jgi:SnoaL-like domain